MATKYTYDDFVNAAQSAGLMDTFTQDDLTMAQNSPDDGMALLGYKQAWTSATTDSQRALAASEANTLRANYKVKSNAIVNGTSPAITTSGLTYSNAYKDQQNNLQNSILNYGNFSYDQSTDPAYAAARKEYLREADRSTANTLGQYATNTGGVASSAATAAASQAGDYYKTQLSDAYNTYRNQAYNEWTDNLGNMRNNLSMVNDAEDTDYNRYLDQENIYQTNRNYSYTSQQDSIDNAMALWDLYGYATPEVSAVLGVAEGTPTSSQAYTDWRVKQAEAKATATGRSGGTRGSGKSGSSGGTRGTGGSSGTTTTNADDTPTLGDTIYVDGYGIITYAMAEKLESAGFIQLTGVDSDGKAIYKKTAKAKATPNRKEDQGYGN